jgi:hypothetical protein
MKLTMICKANRTGAWVASLSVILWATIRSSPHTPPSSGRDVVKMMHEKYAGKWYRTFTFNQTTDIYRNDTLIRKQTWYEAIRFPDRFGIDFGEPDSGNAVIFRGDSSYRFRNSQLRSAQANTDNLTFLLGGMFFRPLDEVLAKIQKDHYNLDKLHEEVWQGRPVYVIGAAKEEDNVNTLWIDKEHLYLVRMITFDNNRKFDGIFEDYKPFGGGWSETKCRFYSNDKLVQVETYYDCAADKPIPDSHFSPVPFSKRQ